MGKSIGVISLKGGVGKTSVVSAIGDAIADFGKKVLLIDANFSAPNLGIHLNIINPEKTIHHVLARKINLEDAIYKMEKFDVIPASLFEKININFMKLKEYVQRLKRNYDYILIDSSPALNEETLSTILASDELIVVTTPDYSTLGTTIKAIKAARQRGTPINGLVLNKVHNKNFEISSKEVEETSGVPVMAVIPHDLNVMKAQANFVPSTRFKKNSQGSYEYKKLAATLIGEKYKRFRLRDLLKICPKRQEINRTIFYQRQFNSQ
jgi:MinD-like ATPase involved in chromosome partitioning or flagellar assembly